MAGVYVHIPFCRQACYYCDFHFSTNLSYRKRMIDALCREIELQKDYLQEPIQTIYFGGGTPSLLDEEDISSLLETLSRCFSLENVVEITLEANPDDLNEEKLKIFRRQGINRLSIGIQTFHDPHLKRLHRLHSSQEAFDAVRKAQDMGFENISIDLIYAIPADTHQIWEDDLQKALLLKVPHISAYNLTIEEKTVLGNWTKKKKFVPADDDFAARQFELLIHTLTQAGYEHYEISNFALPSCYAVHNTNYWRQVPYLGIGASAHSYDGNTRQFNVRNNAHYMASIENGVIPCQVEVLHLTDKINEYVMTSLRTQWGCDLSYLQKNYGFDFLSHHRATVEKLTKKEWILVEKERLLLTLQGKMLADRVIEEFFIA